MFLTKKVVLKTECGVNEKETHQCVLILNVTLIRLYYIWTNPLSVVFSLISQEHFSMSLSRIPRTMALCLF